MGFQSYTRKKKLINQLFAVFDESPFFATKLALYLNFSNTNGLSCGVHNRQHIKAAQVLKPTFVILYISLIMLSI